MASKEMEQLKAIMKNMVAAPENRFPAAAEDCFTVYKALLAEYPDMPIVLIGESAGGYLVFVTEMMARDQKLKMPAAVAAYSPLIELPELAGQFHRSDSVISRYIKMRSGKGVSELLQNMRLERAAELLLATNMDISEVGFSVGYAGESHFISCFRKKYEMTPLQYRRSRVGSIRG